MLAGRLFVEVTGAAVRHHAGCVGLSISTIVITTLLHTAKKKKSNLKIRLLSLLLYEFVKLFTSRTTTIIFIFTNKINKFGGFFVQFISYLLVKKSGKFKYNLWVRKTIKISVEQDQSMHQFWDFFLHNKLQFLNKRQISSIKKSELKSLKKNGFELIQQTPVFSCAQNELN